MEEGSGLRARSSGTNPGVGAHGGPDAEEPESLGKVKPNEVPEGQQTLQLEVCLCFEHQVYCESALKTLKSNHYRAMRVSGTWGKG